MFPVLYLCEFCLKYMKSEFALGRHKVTFFGEVCFLGIIFMTLFLLLLG